MAKSWECDGVPKDEKSYPHQNPPGKHDPYENFGADCVICALPKEAMIGDKSKPPVKAIAAAITGVLTLAVISGYQIWQSQSCRGNKQKIK
ncbi:MAG: hypothetical protein HXY43_15950 [Fischerella sp.]|uniref:hypothetical protein n=1 Tax=Fischerella sp. TaxID=1191 RepID=UPI001803B582|nr:hypothetical protein [Fischerella sp.]NWF60705.1 hypothetical protein [Fischerella sp.]